MKNISKNKKINTKAGFTLIELLITLVIFVTLTGVVLLNKNNFDNAELLHNFAYDVALTIRQAQSYAVNVQENSVGGFSSKYGVFFNTSDTGSNTNFIFFNDFNILGTSDGNHQYDIGNSEGSVTQCPTTSECIQKYAIKNGLYISHMCVGIDESSCNQSNGTVDNMVVLFSRPSFTANIYVPHSITQPTPTPTYAKITLSSPSGASESVVITGIGQVYVKKN